MTHEFFTRMRLDLPLDRVFAFFAQAGNLERITPPELRFRILSPLPIEMKAGTLIDYRLHLLGIPFRWRTRIAVWEPPCVFVDEQVLGPYRTWVHTHRFTPDGVGTRIEDTVRYALPLAPLGDVAHPMVRWQIERIFRFRAQAIGRELGS